MANFDYLLLGPTSGVTPPNEAGEVELVAFASDYGADGPISGIPATLRVVKGSDETVTVGGRFDKCTPQTVLSDENGKWTWSNRPPSSAYSAPPPDMSAPFGGEVRLMNVECRNPPIDKFFVLPDTGGNLLDMSDVP